jgi:hypothetical protein
MRTCINRTLTSLSKLQLQILMSVGMGTLKCSKTQINFKEISSLGEHKIILVDPENSFIVVDTKNKPIKPTMKKSEAKSDTPIPADKATVPTVKLASPAIPKTPKEPANTSESKQPTAHINSSSKPIEEHKTNQFNIKTPIKSEATPSKEQEEEKKLTPISSQGSPRKTNLPSLEKSIELNPEFFMFCLKRKKFAEYYFEIGISNFLNRQTRS